MLLYLTPKRREALPSELSFESVDKSGERVTRKLPSLTESLAPQDTVDLTVVVPAFNETERIRVMLDETLNYLEDGKTKEQSANGAAAPSPLPPPTSYEILIVDDGSSDNTSELALTYTKERVQSKRLSKGEIRVVRLARNRGKGGAVRHGVLHSRGRWILFADADGATRFSDLGLLQREMHRVQTPTGHGVVVGSRAHMVGSAAVVKRSFLRNFLMHSFHIFLTVLMKPPSFSTLFAFIPLVSRPPEGPHEPEEITQDAQDASKSARSSNSSNRTPKRRDPRRRALAVQPEIKDTQCGFKLFTRATAQVIFPLAHIERWIFDVELLLLAEMASKATVRSSILLEQGTVLEERKRLGWPTTATLTADQVGSEDPLLDLPIPIAEVAVHWQEIGGSKIDLIKDSLGMALDLIVIRLNYALGRWKNPAPVQIARRTCVKATDNETSVAPNSLHVS